MILNHVGIVNENKEKAERFYGDFLGLEKTKEAMLPKELSEQLFNYSSEIKIMVFEKDELKIEVFICPDSEKRPLPDIAHIGLFLDDLPQLINKAAEAGVELIIGKTADKTVYFLKDFTGNLLEIKQK